MKFSVSQGTVLCVDNDDVIRYYDTGDEICLVQVSRLIGSSFAVVRKYT